MNGSFLSLFLFSCFIVASYQLGNVRFGHFSSDLFNVDIVVDYNGQQTVNLKYMAFTPYITLEAKKYNVTASKLTGGIIFRTTLNVEDKKYYSSYLYGNGDSKMNISISSSEDSVSSPDLVSGMAAIRFIQLGSLVPTSFNIGSVSLSGVSFTSATSYSPIKAAFYNLTATPDNSNATWGNANLSIGFAYTVVFLPTQPGFPTHFQLCADQDFRVSYLRFSQASPDAPNVFVFVGTAISIILSFQEETFYSSLPYGVQSITAVGPNNVTLAFNGTFAPMAKYTLLTYGFIQPPKNNSNTFKAALISDPVTSPSVATVRFGNLVPDVLKFSLTFGNDSFPLPYGPSSFVTLSRGPGVYEIAVYNSTTLSGRFTRRRMVQGAVGDLVLKKNITLQLGVLSYVFVEGSGGNIFINDDTVVTPTPSPTSSGSSDSGLSGGAIAGIVIACIFGAILIAGIIVYFHRRYQYESIP